MMRVLLDKYVQWTRYATEKEKDQRTPENRSGERFWRRRKLQDYTLTDWTMTDDFQSYG